MRHGEAKDRCGEVKKVEEFKGRGGTRITRNIIVEEEEEAEEDGGIEETGARSTGRSECLVLRFR